MCERRQHPGITQRTPPGQPGGGVGWGPRDKDWFRPAERAAWEEPEGAGSQGRHMSQDMEEKQQVQTRSPRKGDVGRHRGRVPQHPLHAAVSHSRPASTSQTLRKHQRTGPRDTHRPYPTHTVQAKMFVIGKQKFHTEDHLVWLPVRTLRRAVKGRDSPQSSATKTQESAMPPPGMQEGQSLART